MARDAVDVFISYSHDDESLLKELVKHLALLQREGAIRTWHDREITAGEDWRGQLDDRLEEADLILLLVSASFIASDYCWDVETTRALDRHARGETRVVPILVRPCEWQTAPFAEIQGLPVPCPRLSLCPSCPPPALTHRPLTHRPRAHALGLLYCASGLRSPEGGRW